MWATAGTCQRLESGRVELVAGQTLRPVSEAPGPPHACGPRPCFQAGLPGQGGGPHLQIQAGRCICCVNILWWGAGLDYGRWDRRGRFVACLRGTACGPLQAQAQGSKVGELSWWEGRLCGRCVEPLAHRTRAVPGPVSGRAAGPRRGAPSSGSGRTLHLLCEHTAVGRRPEVGAVGPAGPLCGMPAGDRMWATAGTCPRLESGRVELVGGQTLRPVSGAPGPPHACRPRPCFQARPRGQGGGPHLQVQAGRCICCVSILRWGAGRKLERWDRRGRFVECRLGTACGPLQAHAQGSKVGELSWWEGRLCGR